MAKTQEGAECTAFQKYKKATVAWSREPEREWYEMGPGASRGPITWHHGEEYAFNSKRWEAAAGLLPLSCHDLIYMLKACSGSYIDHGLSGGKNGGRGPRKRLLKLSKQEKLAPWN